MAIFISDFLATDKVRIREKRILCLALKITCTREWVYLFDPLGKETLVTNGRASGKEIRGVKAGSETTEQVKHIKHQITLKIVHRRGRKG